MFQGFKFRKTHSKIFEKFLPVVSQTFKQSVKFSFRLSCSEHVVNPEFPFIPSSSSERRQSPQAMITSSSRSIPTTVKVGGSTLQKDYLFICWTSSSDISGYHAEFHEGHGTVGAWQRRNTACVNKRCTACQENGRGTALYV